MANITINRLLKAFAASGLEREARSEDHLPRRRLRGGIPQGCRGGVDAGEAPSSLIKVDRAGNVLGETDYPASQKALTVMGWLAYHDFVALRAYQPKSADASDSGLGLGPARAVR